LFDKFFLTPWTQKSPFLKPIYTQSQCKDQLQKNVSSISQKLKEGNYKINEEMDILLDVFRDIDSNYKNFNNCSRLRAQENLATLFILNTKSF
jgi:hypothetical protein